MNACHTPKQSNQAHKSSNKNNFTTMPLVPTNCDPVVKFIYTKYGDDSHIKYQKTQGNKVSFMKGSEIKYRLAHLPTTDILIQHKHPVLDDNKEYQLYSSL